MRYIKTTNNYVEFIEADDSQNILSVRGFQFGELYFQIKNKKVTFYLNDQENPWRNDVWTINIPFELDGELYEDEDSAAAALEAIINDSFQEQLDEIKEDLADEITRSTAKDVEHDTLISALTEDLEALAEDLEDEIERSTAEDARLDQKIDDEIADRISGDTYLEGLINAETARAEGAESAITAALNAEISRSTAKDNEHDALISGLTSDLADEVARSIAKDAEHDAEISGLTADLNNEITRAMSAETVLHDEILAEEARALAAESALTDALNDEITRSTAKDASHDAEISGLTTSLQNEINRAVGAENSLRNDLNDEVSARTSADSAMVQRITALEVGKADKSDVYTKAESDNKYATKEYVSGNTYTKAEIATMMADKADKLNAVSTALYNSQNKTIDFKNIYGNVIASVDARDFIKDGMVDTVSISGTNLVITFNTDAGKEDIVVPLTDIFDPTNYYDKSDIDGIVSGLNDNIDSKLDASAYTPTDLSNYYNKQEVDASQLAQDNKINAISGDVNTISGDVITLSGNTYNKTEIDNIVNQIESGITEDLENYYTKTQIDASQLAQDNKINAISGDVITLSGDIQTLSGDAITSGEVITLINDAVSGKTIDYLSAGTNVQINNNVISATDTKYTAGESINIDENKIISLKVPIWRANNQSTSVKENDSSNVVLAAYSHAEGYHTKANGNHSHVEGSSSVASGSVSHAEGEGTKANGNYSHSEGHLCVANGESSHAGGFSTRTNNRGEFASGNFNVSDSGSTTSAKTLFSVGNGTADDARHNAFEIKQNGDIYITSGSSDIKLQDHLGGGGGGGIEYSAGTNVQINNHIISATDTTYTAGDGISISNSNVISTVTKFWCGTQAQYDAITIKDPNTVYMIHE